MHLEARIHFDQELLTAALKFARKARDRLANLSSHEIMETGMCLWEAMDEALRRAWKIANEGVTPDGDFDEWAVLADNMWQNEGTSILRSKVVDLVPACEMAWIIYSTKTEGGPHPSFDFEFCPWFMLHCVDPNDLSLRPEWASLTAFKALQDSKPSHGRAFEEVPF